MVVECYSTTEMRIGRGSTSLATAIHVSNVYEMIKCTNVWKEGLLESHFGFNYQNNERNVLQTRLTENPLWLLATTECVGHVAPPPLDV